MAHILLVEDDILNITIFRKVLEKLGGFRVTHSENVDMILDLCRNADIDLILMDISLTNSAYQGRMVDGVAISKLIKAQDTADDTPVILTTAHAMHGDREKYLLESGADGYITKPIVDHQEFIETVRHYLQPETATTAQE